jgi:hypothetical protein
MTGFALHLDNLDTFHVKMAFVQYMRNPHVRQDTGTRLDLRIVPPCPLSNLCVLAQQARLVREALTLVYRKVRVGAFAVFPDDGIAGREKCCIHLKTPPPAGSGCMPCFFRGGFDPGGMHRRKVKHIVPQAVETGDSLAQQGFAALILLELNDSNVGIDLLELVERIEDRTGQVDRHVMIDEPCLGIESG